MMEIRQSTMVKYLDFIDHIKSQTSSFNLAKLVKDKVLDIKFIGFFKKEGYTQEVIENRDLVNKLPKLSETPSATILQQFLAYRNAMEANYKTKKDKEKNFISITQANEMVAQAVKDTKEAVAKEAAEYAQLAVQKGKTDIAGFVYTLLTLN